MNKPFRYLSFLAAFALAFILSVVTAPKAEGANYSLTLNGASTTNNVIFNTAGKIIDGITINNTTGSAVYFSFWDSPTNLTSFSRAAFDATISHMTNLITKYTNYSGVVSTNTNSVYWTTNVTIGSATVMYRNKYTVDVPANSTVSFTPITTWGVNYGLLLTNELAASGTVTVQYSEF